MKRIRYFFLVASLVLLAAGFLAPQNAAAETTAQHFANAQNMTNGVAVMDNGIVYAAQGSSIQGFNEEGVNVFSASLPAKCGNLCAYGDYLFAAGYVAGHMNDIYVLKPGESSACKTLDAGQRAQAVAADYDGYLYCVNSTGTRSNGKKATKILRAKVSDVAALSAGSTINWTGSYQPGYTPPSKDGNCYPQGIAVDGRGYIYIADKGSSNGYDSSVDGIYRYDPVSGSVSPMYFTAGDAHRLFTWVYAIAADDYGTVAVVGRNDYEIAVFRPKSTSADMIVKSNGFPEGVAMDKAGNVYFNASSNSDTAKNGLYRIDLGHVAVTGIGLSASSKNITVGKSFTLSASVTPAGATNKDVLFSSSDPSVASVDASGNVTGKKEGKAVITVKTAQGRMTASCTVTVSKAVAATVTKAANPLKIGAKTAVVKYSKLKKKNQTLKVTKVIKFTKKINDKKNYKLYSAKKGKKSFKKYFKISKTTGKVTVKKGLKKGTYKVKVKVKALGNANYKPSAWKTVTFKVRVR